MRQALLVAGMGGLVGGLAGAGMFAWLRDSGPEPSPAASIALQPASAPRASEAAASGSDTALLRRLERVERTLSALQTRVASAAPSAAAAEPVAGAESAATTAPVVDPVFEAAVLDVLERAEQDRDSERSERRTERTRQQGEHWAAQLTEQLALSPEQAARLLQIRTQLAAALREQSGAAQGRFVPRDERRAATAALRERAELQLKAALDPRQVAQYDQLEGELKLVRPPDSD
jgi:hypothetical protein